MPWTGAPDHSQSLEKADRRRRLERLRHGWFGADMLHPGLNQSLRSNGDAA